MSTLAQLKSDLEYLIDDSIDNETVISLFNECQNVISPMAGYEKKLEGTIKQTIPLPEDFLELVQLLIKWNGQTNYTPATSRSDRFTRYQDSIEFWEEPPKGEYKIRYFAKLPPIQDIRDTLLLKSHFHYLLPLFAAARYMQNEQDELNAKNDFYGEFLRGRAELEMDTTKQRSRMRQRSVRIVRPWG